MQINRFLKMAIFGKTSKFQYKLGHSVLNLSASKVCNKLGCLSLAGLSILIQCLRVRPGDYSRVGGAHERCFTWVGCRITNKHWREKLARDKRSRLLRIYVNYGCKKFNNNRPWSLFLSEASTFLTNFRLRWRGLPGTNPNLLRIFINYGCRSQIEAAP